MKKTEEVELNSFTERIERGEKLELDELMRLMDLLLTSRPASRPTH